MGHETFAEIAHQCIALWNAGKHPEAYRRFYAEDAVKVEPTSLGEFGNELKGRDNLVRHEEMIQGDIASVNSVYVAEGPFIGASGFSVVIKSDFTMNDSGIRFIFREVGVFTVEAGKITREEYLYDEAELAQALNQ